MTIGRNDEEERARLPSVPPASPSHHPHTTPTPPNTYHPTTRQTDLFRTALKRVDVTFQNLDSSEISLTDVSHYYDSDPTKVRYMCVCVNIYKDE